MFFVFVFVFHSVGRLLQRPRTRLFETLRSRLLCFLPLKRVSDDDVTPDTVPVLRRS